MSFEHYQLVRNSRHNWIPLVIIGLGYLAACFNKQKHYDEQDAAIAQYRARACELESNIGRHNCAQVTKWLDNNKNPDLKTITPEDFEKYMKKLKLGQSIALICDEYDYVTSMADSLQALPRTSFWNPTRFSF